MRKFAVALMTSLFSSSVVLAFLPEATDSSLEIGVGYRQDSLEWKTKSDMTSSYGSYGSYGSYDSYYSEISLPYKLESKQKWKDLSIWQIEANGKYVTCDSVYLRGNFDYGWITSGKSVAKDYITDESEYSGYNSYGSGFEFAKSKAHVSGHVYDAKLALGYQFKLCDDSFSIAPLVGYSWHGQHLQDSHVRSSWYSDESIVEEEVTTRAYSSSSDSSFSSDSSYPSDYSSSGHDHNAYHTRWNGPFIGFDFDYRFGFGCGCDLDWQLFGAYEFHWAAFHGEGKVFSNGYESGSESSYESRSEFKFHQHASNAYGNVFDIGVKWDFCECWTLALKGEFQWWWADHGRSVVKVAEEEAGDVKFKHTVSTPLRDVRWDSASVILDLGMVF